MPFSGGEELFTNILKIFKAHKLFKKNKVSNNKKLA